MTHPVGAIVTARGREWVVQPGSTDSMLTLQPLGGNPLEETVILPGIEKVDKAEFAPPNPEQMGDNASAWLLRAAARIGNSNAAGPFRCLGRIGVQPRPYQYVPLLMALKQEPVRMLVADDVGVGKTVEALLIARELWDRGEIDSFCVLCPPHLAEQWRDEIKEKFSLDAELYISTTADKIHRKLAAGESPFKRHPVMVASIELVKQDGRRETFLQHAPNFIIVDEAHACTAATDEKQLRYKVIEQLSRDRARHLVLVTATPHTGKEDAFGRMVGLLDPDLQRIAEQLNVVANRQKLAQYMVQRRRGDIQDYMEGTSFPKLEVKEESYTLSNDARALLVEIVDAVQAQYDNTKVEKEKRVQWWSLLSMARAFASSPKALAATLRTRNITAESESAAEANRLGQNSMLEEDDDQTTGAGVQAEYAKWAERADGLAGTKDHKLKAATSIVEDLLKESRGIIVFCQFVETAEYVAEHLRSKLKGATIDFVTGRMDGEDRRQRIADLEKKDRRVLVATDCLSEGINLQAGFDAVVHYDLAWVPTRHEQREGRVDRYGQKSPKVRSVVYYGKDNLIDGVVLEVLIRKHEQIRRDIQVRVPVPKNHADVTEAIMESLLLRKKSSPFGQTSLQTFGAEAQPFHAEWEARGEREKRSRTVFAQASIKESEVAEAIEAAQRELGASDVEEFVKRAVAHPTMKGTVSAKGDAWSLGAGGVDDDVKHALGLREDLLVRFTPDPTKDGEYLHRSHPLVRNLCQYIVETATDGIVPGPAARCSAVVTRAVTKPTALYVVRFRYHMRLKGSDRLIEDIAVLGSDAPGQLKREDDLKVLFGAAAAGNLDKAARTAAVERAVASLSDVMPHIKAEGEARCREAKRLHEKVRDAANLGLGKVDLKVNGEPDILGVYVFLPKEGKP
ncbi:MAG: DEAD/DEAH box helicase [Candidatus Thermoplasmatota archaeon]